MTPVKTVLKGFVRHYENLQQARLYTKLHDNLDPAVHIREAAQWLVRAQNHGSDRGFSYGANLGQGFLPSYPETTGYIIPTFLKLAEYFGDESYVAGAVEAGIWETAIQLPTGAVQSGMYKPADPNPQPAVFNTGQVLLGWTELLRKTNAATFRDAGLRASRWLVEMQDPDGNWIRGNSNRAKSEITVYNVKSAWGLCAFSQLAGYPEGVAAAIRNGEYAIRKQLPNGWYRDCCLDDASQPLLHTVAYAMQGLIGIGRLTGRNDLIEASRWTADSLIALMDSEGFIPGRIDSSFRGTVDWCCLTGSAQTSEVCAQLFHLTGDQKYLDATRRLNRYLMARHDISNPNLAIRGAVAGSWPVGGDYGRFKVLNWATKFFLDALLAEAEIQKNAGR